MQQHPAFIHNGSGLPALRAGLLYVQIPLRGEGLTQFCNKQLRFDAKHLRLFSDPADAVRLANGTCLTYRLAAGLAPEWADVRFPVDASLHRQVARIVQRHGDQCLPAALPPGRELHRLERETARLLEALRARIDALPGRSLYKRIDTYLRLERARDHMEQRFSEDPSSEQLAAAAAISRAHFIRLFGSFYGVSPKQRVLELKVAEAKRLLTHTQLSIWEVATASGFGNRCAFQRMFRDRVGLTPGRFRARAGRPARLSPGAVRESR